MPQINDSSQSLSEDNVKNFAASARVEEELIKANNDLEPSGMEMKSDDDMGFIGDETDSVLVDDEDDDFSLAIDGDDIISPIPEDQIESDQYEDPYAKSIDEVIMNADKSTQQHNYDPWGGRELNTASEEVVYQNSVLEEPDRETTLDDEEDIGFIEDENDSVLINDDDFLSSLTNSNDITNTEQEDQDDSELYEDYL